MPILNTKKLLIFLAALYLYAVLVLFTLGTSIRQDFSESLCKNLKSYIRIYGVGFVGSTPTPIRNQNIRLLKRNFTQNLQITKLSLVFMYKIVLEPAMLL